MLTNAEFAGVGVLFEVRLRLCWFIGLGVCLVGLPMIARFGLRVWVNSVGIDFLAFVILRLYFRVVVRLWVLVYLLLGLCWGLAGFDLVFYCWLCLCFVC